jgi:hypothetical protein
LIQRAEPHRSSRWRPPSPSCCRFGTGSPSTPPSRRRDELTHLKKQRLETGFNTPTVRGLKPGACTPRVVKPGAYTPRTKTPGAYMARVGLPGACMTRVMTPCACTPRVVKSVAYTPRTKTPGAYMARVGLPGACMPRVKTTGACAPRVNCIRLVQLPPRRTSPPGSSPSPPRRSGTGF